MDYLLEDASRRTPTPKTRGIIHETGCDDEADEVPRELDIEKSPRHTKDLYLRLLRTVA